MHVSEDYISLAIARISSKMKLSESLAGATLLALANGATDLITVVMASLAGGDDNDLAIGSLFGANLFTCSVVLGLTILASKGSTVRNLNKGNAIFDLTFFVIGISIFLFVGSLNTYMFVTGICLLSVYIAYLVVLIYRDKSSKDRETPKDIELAVENLKLLPDIKNTDDDGDVVYNFINKAYHWTKQ